MRGGCVLQRLTKRPSLAPATRYAMAPDLPGNLDDEGLLTDCQALANTGYHPTCMRRMEAEPVFSVLELRLRCLDWSACTPSTLRDRGE